MLTLWQWSIAAVKHGVVDSASLLVRSVLKVVSSQIVHSTDDSSILTYRPAMEDDGNDDNMEDEKMNTSNDNYYVDIDNFLKYNICYVDI